MRHFFLLLFSLLQLTAFSQKATGTFQVDLSDYYKKSQVDSLIRASGGVVKPPVKKPDCQDGPEIRDIRDITLSSATLQFHGKGVDTLQFEVWKIGGSLISSGLIAPKSSVVSFGYPNQTGSVNTSGYTLVIRGYSCNSKDDRRDFPIKSDVGGGVVDPPHGGNSSSQLVNIVKGMPMHLTLDINKTEQGFILNDISTEKRQSDKHSYRYIVGGHIITQKEPLTNYLVAGTNPFRVLKFKIRDDIPSIDQWGDGRPETYVNSGYYFLDAGEAFSFNTSYAFNTFFTRNVQQQGFLNHISQSYDPSKQVPTWAEIAPDMQLPKGHFWINGWTGWGSADNVFRKGVTHLPHHSLPWNDADGNRYVIELKNSGKTYSDVPRIETIFRLRKQGENDYSNGWNRAWWPNGPLGERESIDAANNTDASDAIWIGEVLENEAWMPSDVPMWRWFYKRLRERYEERFGSKGIPYEIVHNYFFLWPRDISLTRDKPASYYKDLLRKSASELPRTEYSPGGTLVSTTMITEGVYLSSPDLEIDCLYKSIFRMAINEILGYKSGVFLAAVHETRPNNKYQYRYSNGTYYTDNKIPLDPNIHIGYGFLAHIYGNLFTEWGGDSKVDPSQKKFDPEWNTGWWYPTGATDPQPGFPYFGRTGYYGFNGGTDLSYFSQRLYNETFGKTDGGERKYLRFSVDNGAWITPSQFKVDEVVDAFDAKRGFVFSQTKDGRTAWFYLNAFADNNPHTLRVELPNGQVVAETVAGNGIHAKLL